MLLSPTDATNVRANDFGGALEALVNYWITKIRFEDTGETKAVPEYNLGDGAGMALFEYLGGRLPESSDAFALGLRLAGIVQRNPWDAGDEVRAAIAEAAA
jgi:hypothetical protein